MNIAAHLALFESAVAATQVSLGGNNDVLFDWALERTAELLRDADRVVLIGNGGSAAVAAHVANDLFSCGVPATTLYDPATLTCLANDYGYENVFIRQIAVHKPDVLIAISSSGMSSNIVTAVVEFSSIVIGFTGFKPDNPLREKADTVFYVPSYDYGIVEVAHQFILHNITDRLKAMSKAVKVAAE